MARMHRKYDPHRGRLETVGLLLMAVLVASTQTIAGAVSGVFDIRDHGAVGNGETLDTPAIQKAIDACASAGGGQVRFPPGRYLSGTIHLKSHVTLFLEADATLGGTSDLDQYAQPDIPDFMPEARWGKWHRALIVGEGLEDIGIAGSGTIDGNKVFDPTGEENMRGPHTFVFVDCRRVTVREVSFVDAANYAIFFQVSHEVEIRNVKIIGGWDAVHFRGGPEHPCRDVAIVGCQFFTGDDAIAGRYWENTLISDCIINSSCNGIRLIGPAEHLIIHDCLFYGPGVRPHRSSDRNNMLAGINLQPGAWDATRGRLDDVQISDVTMHNVAAAFHFSLKPGNTAGSISVSRVNATGIYRAASSVESWAPTAFENVAFRDVTLEYTGGGTRRQAQMEVRSPGVDARPLPAWGFYTRKVANLEFDDVRLRLKTRDLRPALICDGVERLTLNDFRFDDPSEQVVPLLLNDVGAVKFGQTDLPGVAVRCAGLSVPTDDEERGVLAGAPYAVKVIVESTAAQAGLAQVELLAAGTTASQWVWLQPGVGQEVLFDNLTAPDPGTYELRCDPVTRDLHVRP